jgi:paraquat-inducible protein B
MDAGGMTINTESLLSIVMGGIAFQPRDNTDETAQAEQGHNFKLYNSKDAALKEPDNLVENYQLIFNESVRGLTVGATVELRGIVVGEVTRIRAMLDHAGRKIRMAVRIRFYPDRLKYISADKNLPSDIDDHRKLLDRLVANGFRAQLQSGSLLTGQLFVALDFFPNAPPARIIWQDNPPELPTISGNMAQLQATLMKIVQKLEKLPLENLGTDLHRSLNSLDAALTSANSLMQNLDANLVPEAKIMLQDIRKTLDSADNTLQEVRLSMNEGSPLQTDLRETLRELGRAAQSLRLLGDYLEQNPEALLRGKRGD